MNDDGFRIVMSPEVAASFAALLMAVATGVTWLFKWGKNRLDVAKVESGQKERRRRDANGSGPVCVLAKGQMPDTALPPKAEAYYEGTTEILKDIAQTLRDNREADAEHRRQEIHSLKTLTLLQIKASEKMGITITPTDLDRL